MSRSPLMAHEAPLRQNRTDIGLEADFRSRASQPRQRRHEHEQDCEDLLVTLHSYDSYALDLQCSFPCFLELHACHSTALIAQPYQAFHSTPGTRPRVCPSPTQH